jgi:hypothetical protein
MNMHLCSWTILTDKNIEYLYFRLKIQENEEHEILRISSVLGAI